MFPLIVVGVGMMSAGVFMRRREGEGGALLTRSDEVASLARVLTSEAGSGPVAERTAIGWAVRNRARKAKKTITALVCTPCGPQGPGRPFSSRQAPTQVNLQLAEQIIAAPQSADPTSGATSFFEPKQQDLLVAKGLPGYKRTAAAVRAKWIAEGAKPKGSVGRFEFFA